MKRETAVRYVRFGLVGCLALALVLALTVGLFPPATARAASAPAHAEKLGARYDLGDIVEENDTKYLKASRWDIDTSAYVDFPEAQMAITGPVSQTLGVQGKGGALFAAKSYASMEFGLDPSVDGVTFSVWARNWTDDWGGFLTVTGTLNEGTENEKTVGFRFGKSDIQETDGTLTGYKEGTDGGRHFFPGLGTVETGAGWDSFVTMVVDNNEDRAPIDEWYQVTVTVTATSMKLYRNGELKITYDETSTAAGALADLFAAMQAGGGEFALRATLNNDTTANDEMDDFRIYFGALTADEVATLYTEYSAYKSNFQLLKTDDATYGSTAIPVGLGKTAYTIQVSDGSAPFPKLLLGNATDVTEDGGTYTGNGDVTYSYTVTGDTATLVYNGNTVTVTREYKDVASTLIVRYGMDGVVDGKLQATKWQDGKFVAYPEMDATITGTLTPVDGQEVNAINFPADGKAIAAGNFVLPQGADGATFMLWSKDARDDWAGSFCIADGTDGARFGKGCLQATDSLSGWKANAWPGLSDKFSNGGAPLSFVVSDDTDGMTADTWYHVAVTVTQTEMKLYRDGVLKITLDTGGDSAATMDIPKILQSLWTAMTNGKGKLAINQRQEYNTATNSGIMDDLRIYGTAMAQADINALYAEYKTIASVKGITLKTSDTAFGAIATPINTSDPNFEITVLGMDTFPELYLGDVTTVTENNGTYTGSGTGIEYSYTIDGDVATLTYLTDAGERTIYIKRVQLQAYLTSLTVTVDGTAADIGFDSSKKEYTLELTPNAAAVTFAATAEGGTVQLPESVNYNGANKIAVMSEGGAELVAYTVTIKRGYSDVLTSLKGVTIGATTQILYVDEIPESVTDADAVLAYAATASVSVSYAKPTATVTVTDTTTNHSTTYTITYASKADGQFAHWSMDGTTAAKVWDVETQTWQDSADLTFQVYQGKDATAATADDDKKRNAAYASAGLGNGLKLAQYQFAAVTLPRLQGVSEFTVAAYVNLDKDLAWAPIFSLYDNAYTRGALLEKSMLQFPSFSGGKVTNDYNDNTYHGGNTNCAQDAVRWQEDADNEAYTYKVFNGDIYLTITVSYLDGKGVIKYYVNGVHILTYENNEQVDNICADMMYALDSGAHLGLRRHCFDSQGNAMYDDLRLYGYAMTADDAAAQYADFAAVRGITVAAKAVEGKTGYPTLDIGADEATSGGKRVGTFEGASYAYTPISGDATKAKDTAGVEVTFTKGIFIRTVTVSYNRTFTVSANKLGYTVDGQSGQVTIESGKTEYTARVSAAADLTADNAVTAGTHDVEAGHTVTVTYDKDTKTATYTVTYSDYDDLAATYTVTFAPRSTVSSLTSVTVSGIKSGGTRVLDDAAFGSAKTASIAVASKANFSLTLTFVLPEGATVEGATGDTLTLTQANMTANKVTFTVISEDGGDHKTVYTLEISDVSSDATLKGLAVTGHTISPAFAINTHAYTIELQDADDAAALVSSITATKNNDAATVDTKYVTGGDKFVVTVTAEDGTTKLEYVITIRRVSADATLKEIKFSVGDKTLEGFDAATTEYTVKYNTDVAKEYGTLTATANNAAATVSVGALKDGKIEITVTAENGKDTRKYTLTFVKRSTVNTLASVTVNGKALTLEPGKMTYDYEAPAGTDITTLVVVATPTDSLATVTTRTDEAEGKIFITVTAENGSKANYTISVTTASAPKPDETPAKKKGCGSSAAADPSAAALLVLALGGALALRRKSAARK